MVVVNGWEVFTHPLFLDQLERLTAAVEAEESKRSLEQGKRANAKLLTALRKLVLETIPGDPSRPEYRQGATLGAKRKHWFRAKFGGGRFRLFFRYDSAAKIIIFAWVNDETNLRTYGSKADAYAVFRSMLDGGDPPDDWTALMKAASTREAEARLAKAKKED